MYATSFLELKNGTELIGAVQAQTAQFVVEQNFFISRSYVS